MKRNQQKTLRRNRQKEAQESEKSWKPSEESVLRERIINCVKCRL